MTTLRKPFTLPLPDVVPSKAMVMDLHTGQMTIIPVTNGQAYGVNASGVVIGNIESTGAGWVYRNGKVSMLPQFHGQPTVPLAIDARGDIVGEVTIGTNLIWVIWRADHPGTVRQLLPKNLIANTISDTGLIGGSIGPLDRGRPYVGDGNGTGHTLPTGTSDPQGDLFRISGDYAVGSGPIFGGRYPLVWNLVTGQVTTYSNIDGSLNAVSDDGTAIGEAGYGQTGILFPVIASGGRLNRLPTGIGNSPEVYMTASDLTADGHTIVGTNRTNATTDGPYTQVGLLWHC